MASEMHGYLEGVERGLHLEPFKRDEILNELQTHIEDRAEELVQEGKSSEDALRHAVDRLGPSQALAKGFYAVHSRGPWHHTALAVLPHVLLALTYAFHLWTNPVWVGAMLVVALATSVVGWRKGRPSWAYPWLGYALAAPIVSWGLAMSAVGYGAWGILTRGALPLGVPIYVASFVYIFFSLWVVIRFVSRVVRPDWVMASLAILPIPFLAYWFFFFYNWGFQDQGELPAAKRGRQQRHDCVLDRRGCHRDFLPRWQTVGAGGPAGDNRPVDDRAGLDELPGWTRLRGRVHLRCGLHGGAAESRALRSQRHEARGITAPIGRHALRSAGYGGLASVRATPGLRFERVHR